MGSDLAFELGDRIGTGPRDGLIRVHDDPLETDAVAQGHQDGRELHGRAVRVGDDAHVAFEVVRIDLRHDERDRRIHPPGGRVVDHGRAMCHCGGRELLRDVGARREEGDVDAIEGLGRGLADLVRLAVDGNGPTDRSPGREQTQPSDGKLSFVEDLDHGPADDAGGSDDGDGEGFVVHLKHGSADAVAGTGTAGV